MPPSTFLLVKAKAEARGQRSRVGSNARRCGRMCVLSGKSGCVGGFVILFSLIGMYLRYRQREGGVVKAVLSESQVFVNRRSRQVKND